MLRDLVLKDPALKEPGGVPVNPQDYCADLTVVLIGTAHVTAEIKRGKQRRAGACPARRRFAL
jgi:hypothetical protein